MLVIDGQALLRHLLGEFFELLRHKANERRTVEATMAEVVEHAGAER